MTGHREHVHAEWYDRCGELRGEHGPELVNFTDKPESILTARQWADIKRLADEKN